MVEPVGVSESERLADAMAAFAAPSRLRLLYALIEAELSVEQLAATCEMTATAASQQLRVLRQLHAVQVRRDGRRAFYRLHDHHMVDLLAAIRHHGEHRTLAPRPATPPATATV